MSENSSLAPNEQKKNETRVSYTTENGNTFMASQGLSPEKIEKLSVETDIMFFKKKTRISGLWGGMGLHRRLGIQREDSFTKR